MDYPLILRCQYTYIISGNFYKPAENVFYQLLTKDSAWKIISEVESVSDRHQVNLVKMDKVEITFSYKYIRYTASNTYSSDTEVVEEVRTLKRDEETLITCVETYWNYARGGENGPATLFVKWISYGEMMQELQEMAKKDRRWAEKTARFLIDEEMYAEAFGILKDVGKDTVLLGLCYEKGYGTEVDPDKALEIYLNDCGFEAERGIERIFAARGRTIKFDAVKKAALFYEFGNYGRAYNSAVVPTEMADNTLSDMRKNVELCVLLFLEIGRPFNDPFGSPSDTMCNLATYYDVINDRPLEERPVYHTVEWEDDPYDGGSFRHDIYHNDLIIETLKKEAEKNDVIALGCLLVQFGLGNGNEDFTGHLKSGHEELIERLIFVANEGSKLEQGMACYFLGLYYKRVAEKATENYGYDFDIKDMQYTYIGNDIEKDLDDYLARKNAGVEKPLLKKVQPLIDEHRYLVVRKPEEKEEIRQLENFIIHLFTQRREKHVKLHDESIEKAHNRFQAAVDRDFHLAVPHLANKIVEEEGEEKALQILEAHEKFIPYFNRKTYCAAEQYHELLKKLREST